MSLFDKHSKILIAKNAVALIGKFKSGIAETPTTPKFFRACSRTYFFATSLVEINALLHLKYICSSKKHNLEQGRLLLARGVRRVLRLWIQTNQH